MAAPGAPRPQAPAGGGLAPPRAGPARRAAAASCRSAAPYTWSDGQPSGESQPPCAKAQMVLFLKIEKYSYTDPKGEVINVSNVIMEQMFWKHSEFVVENDMSTYHSSLKVFQLGRNLGNFMLSWFCNWLLS